EQSQFYQQGLPQGLKKIYQIDYSVLPGGHMFPLEQPKQVAEYVKAKLKTLG
ncbi:alpha/beta hydrolase, partial [Acinetobacter junii]